MTEEKKKQSVDHKKVILISVFASLGTVLVGFLIWYLLFSSQFGSFREDKYGIRIKYPKEWSLLKNYEGTVVTVVSPKEDGLDSFQESLNIAVMDLSSRPLSLAQYTEIAIKQMNAVFEKNIIQEESVDITFAGLPAHRYIVKAPEPQDIILKVIWFIKDNQAYTITIAAQMFSYEEKYGPLFDEMLRSFSIPAY